MAHAIHASQVAFLGAQKTLSPFAAVALRAAVVLHLWSLRRQTRIGLSRLDAHLLRDIGLDRLAAEKEANRMFWHG